MLCPLRKRGSRGRIVCVRLGLFRRLGRLRDRDCDRGGIGLGGGRRGVGRRARGLFLLRRGIEVGIGIGLGLGCAGCLGLGS